MGCDGGREVGWQRRSHGGKERGSMMEGWMGDEVERGMSGMLEDGWRD